MTDTPEVSAGPPPTPIVVSLDVVDLDASCEFYRRTLGFEAVSTCRPGMKLEWRLLTSEDFPGVALQLRAAFGKRVGGSQPGGMLRLSLAHPSVASAVEKLGTSVRWITTTQAPPATQGATSVSFVDPNGYHIELCERLGPLV